jgi:hypothetical protein
VCSQPIAILGSGLATTAEGAAAGGKEAEEVEDVMIGRSLKVGGVRCHCAGRPKKLAGIDVKGAWPGFHGPYNLPQSR